MRNRLESSLLWLFLFALIFGLLGAGLWASRLRSAQAQERSDLNLFLTASSAGWAEATDRFFETPEAAASLLIGLNANAETDEERVQILSQVVRSQPVFDAAFISDSDGNFVFVGRSNDGGDGFRTRRLSVAPEREVIVTTTDANLNELDRSSDVNDTFDPLTRPWFLTGAGNPDQWTEPYTFASSGELGITFSARDSATGIVVGIDLRLDELGRFLDALKPNANGVAILVAVDVATEPTVIASSVVGDGPLISFSDEDTMVIDVGSVSDTIAQLQSSQAAEFALDDSSDGGQTIVTRPVRPGREWFLSVQAEDSDFLGEFSLLSPRNLLGIFVVGVAAAIVVAAIAHRLQGYRASLKHEAERDALTGLLSRRAMERQLERGLRDHPVLTVSIIDLDRFKIINDDNGHLVGDQVLAEVGRRLESFAAEAGAKAGRLGGDEFATISAADLRWGELIELFRMPIEVDGSRFTVGSSIGISHGSRAEGSTPEKLLRAADQALFTVKRSGGNDFAFALPNPEERVETTRSLR